MWRLQESLQVTSDLNAVESTYAVTNRDEKQIMKATSGGLFSAAASAILSDGGCVFGARLILRKRMKRLVQVE